MNLVEAKEEDQVDENVMVRAFEGYVVTGSVCFVCTPVLNVYGVCFKPRILCLHIEIFISSCSVILIFLLAVYIGGMSLDFFQVQQTAN